MKTEGLYKGELFSTDISVSVAQIKKIQKTKWFYFQILLLGGPSPPSQLVPNPFNWSPNTFFYRYHGIGRSNKKNLKTRCIFSVNWSLNMFFVEFSSLFFIGFPFVYHYFWGRVMCQLDIFLFEFRTVEHCLVWWESWPTCRWTRWPTWMMSCDAIKIQQMNRTTGEATAV